MAGIEDLSCGGGVESMSRLGIGASGAAQGDAWVAMKTYGISQGLGADMVATMNAYSREDVDRYAVRSQQRAAAAWKQGYFDNSVIPVRDMNGVVVLDHDELVRPETTLEALSSLKPAFKMFNDFGHGDLARLKYPQLENIVNVHTPGNSSGIVDGASLVLVGNEQAGIDSGMVPRARMR